MIFELARRLSRNSTRILRRSCTPMMIITGSTAATISASRQLMMAMKTSEVPMFMMAQVVSTTPQVIRSATRLLSEVTRAISRPTAFWA